jgi:hypothetical protein
MQPIAHHPFPAASFKGSTVIDFTTRLPRRPTLAAQARDRVFAALHDSMLPRSIVTEAQARAENNVLRGTRIEEAVRRALAWAHSKQSPSLPPAA